MCEIVRAGPRHAGIPHNELEFFDIPIACDDAHALTRERMMLSDAGRPGYRMHADVNGHRRHARE